MATHRLVSDPPLPVTTVSFASARVETPLGFGALAFGVNCAWRVIAVRFHLTNKESNGFLPLRYECEDHWVGHHLHDGTLISSAWAYVEDRNHDSTGRLSDD